MSTSSSRMSVSLPLPSSPHCVPTTTVPGTWAHASGRGPRPNFCWTATPPTEPQGGPTERDQATNVCFVVTPHPYACGAAAVIPRPGGSVAHKCYISFKSEEEDYKLQVQD